MVRSVHYSHRDGQSTQADFLPRRWLQRPTIKHDGNQGASPMDQIAAGLDQMPVFRNAFGYDVDRSLAAGRW
jgi:hypothetical protein